MWHSSLAVAFDAGSREARFQATIWGGWQSPISVTRPSSLERKTRCVCRVCALTELAHQRSKLALYNQRQWRGRSIHQQTRLIDQHKAETRHDPRLA